MSAQLNLTSGEINRTRPNRSRETLRPNVECGAHKAILLQLIVTQLVHKPACAKTNIGFLQARAPRGRDVAQCNCPQTQRVLRRPIRNRRLYA